MAMDYKEFVSKKKSMLIAPAGYGKTYSIAACLEHTDGKQLILTHTHAGISSIKEKIKAANISPTLYHIETITSYAQKYVLSFYTGNDIPRQENSREYYPFIIDKAIQIFNKQSVKEIIAATYAGLFVDEYQDCSLSQHDLVLALSEFLPTRVLGDPLQGIFNFGHDGLVNLDDDVQMNGFVESTYELTEPYRWKATNEPLGDDLKQIREKLLLREPIDLRNYPSIQIYIENEVDLFNPSSRYCRSLWKMLEEQNLLIIYPESHNIESRKRIVGNFRNSFVLVEAIDDKNFYEVAKIIDTVTNENIEKTLRDVCQSLFNIAGVAKWFNETGFKRKTGAEEIALLAPIRERLLLAKTTCNTKEFLGLLQLVSRLPDIKTSRKELLKDVLKSLESAIVNNVSVYESMISQRNHIRRIGRKVFGKSIGTTLLTKGLEFETVIVLNAHKFKCHKNLYVALTRASHKLIVFTNNQILTPYPAE